MFLFLLLLSFPFQHRGLWGLSFQLTGDVRSHWHRWLVHFMCPVYFVAGDVFKRVLPVYSVVGDAFRRVLHVLHGAAGEHLGPGRAPLPGVGPPEDLPAGLLLRRHRNRHQPAGSPAGERFGSTDGGRSAKHK